MSVEYTVRQGIALITLDCPPVNSFGVDARRAFAQCLETAQGDAAANAVIITGRGRLFSAGADIEEFGERSLAEPNLPTLVARIDQFPKPVIAAINGAALGGGCEVALACHYRVGVPAATIALPEVTLGILAGAGGTQRLPRLIGVPAALEMILSGQTQTARRMAELGFFDRLFTDDLLDNAVQFAAEILRAGGKRPRLSDRTIDPKSLPGGADLYFAQARAAASAQANGAPAPGHCVDAVEAAVRLPFAEGSALELKLAKALLATDASKALCHLFFAERAAARKTRVAPPGAPVRSVAILETRGSGCALARLFAAAGVPITAIEYPTADATHGSHTVPVADLRDIDLVIEAAATHDIGKIDLCNALAPHLKSDAVLATTAGSAALQAIALSPQAPAHIAGLAITHERGPAAVVEIVRTPATSDRAAAALSDLARRAGCVSIIVNASARTVGERMFRVLTQQAYQLRQEGIAPRRIDAALQTWGFKEGPIAAADQIERDNVLYSYAPHTGLEQSPLLVDATDQRLSQQITAGQGARVARKRILTDENIVERCLYPLINEGARLLEEGVATSAAEIDLVWVTGYGFPRHRGGPMFFADSIGAQTILRGLTQMARLAPGNHPVLIPAPLLVRLAERGRCFRDYSQSDTAIAPPASAHV